MTSTLIRYIFGLTAMLSLVCTGLYFQFEHYLDRPLEISGELVIDIRPGSSMQQVANQLAEEAGLRQPRIFSLWTRFNGFDTGLKAGEYALQEGMSPRSALTHLMSGQSIQYPVVFIEGTNVRQALNTLWTSPKLLNTLKGRSDEEILSILQSPSTSLEGILFPDTYFYTAGATDVSILRRAAAQLQTILAKEWEDREVGLPLSSPYEALILASVIEKETGQPAERPLIAAVFVNRLKFGMKLQTDPTVIYGLGAQFDGNLRKRDLLADGPYNTYTRTGLPPTPIALPGVAALTAALNPAPSKALYFVARGDGSSYFSNTLAEHERAVTKYQRRGRH